MQSIFTIGTRGMHDEPFLRLLHEHDVDAVIDVRLRNDGWRYGFASARHIHELLDKQGIVYAHELRFAPTDEILLAYGTTGNWADYVAAFDKLIEGRNMAAVCKDRYADFRNPCLLCAEDTPAKCHRRLLAEYLSDEFGVPIIHLVRMRPTTCSP